MKRKLRGKPRAKPRKRSAGTPRLQLSVVDRSRPRFDRALLRRVVKHALAVGGKPGMTVSLLLTDDREIAALHDQFLADPSATDVITFEIDGAAEIVVSVETAKRCAKGRGHTTKDEVCLYVAHGILHACGFDDLNKKDRVAMRKAEQETLALLGITIHDVDSVTAERSHRSE